MRTRREALSIQSVGQEVLLLDRDSDNIHQLNQTATFIWRKCDEGMSPPEVAQLLAEEYEIGEDVAKRAVSETLDKLQALKLVFVVE